MKNLVAIIVGGTGQFGVITSEFLLKRNYKVIITTRSINKKKKLFKKHKNLSLYKLNIYNKKKINEDFIEGDFEETKQNDNDRKDN